MAKAPTAPAPRRARSPAPGGRAPATPVKAAAAPAPAAPRPRTSPQKFVAEVRQEVRKITWPTWRETWITSVMVFLMVLFTALFFFVVDGGALFLVSNLLKLAG
jgi:preprotein translocase subunit SecE